MEKNGRANPEEKLLTWLKGFRISVVNLYNKGYKGETVKELMNQLTQVLLGILCFTSF